MADDDDVKAGDDPWAGLESEQSPDLSEGFALSFDEAPSSEADEPLTGMAADPSSEQRDGEGTAGDDALDEWVEESDGKSPDEESSSPELSVFQSDDDEGSDDAEASSGMIGQSAVDIGTGDSGIPSGSTIESLVSQQSGLGGGDPFASIGGEHPEAAIPETEAQAEPDVVAEAEAPASAEAEAHDDTATAIGRDPSLLWSGDPMDEAAMSGTTFDFTAIAAAADSSLHDAAGDADERDPFIVNSAADDVSSIEAADDTSPAGEFSFGTGDGETSAGIEGEDFGGAMMAVGAAEQPKTEKKSSRPAPARKKKPSAVGQMVGVIFGGAMAFPIVVLILWWIVGKDALNVAPLVPDALSFIVPAKLRSGGQVATGGSHAPSLDDVLGGITQEPADPDEVAVTDPSVDPMPEPEIPQPEPVEPSDTDLAALTPTTGTEPVDAGGDPLGDLLNEEPATPAEPPQPAPAPVPLDTAALDAAAQKALSALAAVQSVDDPSDPVLKKLMVECYKALSGYAQELATLERVAIDTGRALETMPAAVASVGSAITDRPELFQALARLTRDWMTYAKRSSDGVVAPVTLVSVRRVGPYWRAEVTLGEQRMVVLAQSEPEAAPGDMVIVTGLTVDGGVVWATQMRPAKASDPLFDP